MKSLKNSITKSFFSASFHKFINLTVDKSHLECHEKLKSDIQQKLFESTREIILAVETLLPALKYPCDDCLIGVLKAPKYESLLHNETVERIRTLQSLITRLMFCYAIETDTELETHKEKWSECAKDEKCDDHSKLNHRAVYKQFVNVNSVDQMQEFNGFFRNYISDLLFELCDDIKQRILFDMHEFSDQKDMKTLLKRILEMVEIKNKCTI